MRGRWLFVIAGLTGFVSCSSGGSGDAAAPPPSSALDAGAEGGPDAAADAPGSTDANADADGAVPCPAGQANAFDGTCFAVGIQGCDAIFVEADGVCRPRLAKCPKGQIPDLDTGCVPVGITSCAADFLGDDGLCHPTMTKCPTGTFAVPQEGCVPIDGPDGCGSGTWGNVPDAPTSYYVDPSAPKGGDGSKGLPMTTIAAAMSAVPKGGRVVLAAGVYDEPLLVQKGVEIVGRCPSMVRVQGVYKLSGGSAVALVVAGGVTLRSLEIGGAAVGILVLAPATVVLDRVHVKQATLSGVYLNGKGASGVATHLFVEGTKAPTGVGVGIQVQSSASLTMSSSAVVGNTDFGANVTGGASLTMSSTLIEGTLPNEAGNSDALSVDAGGHAKLDGVALVANIGRAFQVDGAASTAAISGSTIEGTLPAPDGTRGIGVAAGNGATLTLTGSAILASRDGGVFADSDATVTVTSCLVRDTDVAAATMDGGEGVHAQENASITLDRSTIAHNRSFGVAAVTGGAITLTSSIVEDTEAIGPETGVGVAVVGGSQLTIDRSEIVGSVWAGVFVWNTPATITGSLVEHTKPGNGDFGIGVMAQQSTLAIAGTLVADNAFAGILATAGAHVTVGASRITRTVLANAHFDDDTIPNMDVGDGLIATGNAATAIDRLTVDACARAGIVFDDSPGTIRGALATGNVFGLVTQGTAKPTLVGVNVFSGNSKQDTVVDGALAVPTGHIAVPTGN